MTKSKIIPVFFHMEQLNHKPLYEWAFGDKLQHPETTSRAESIFNQLLAEPDIFAMRTPANHPLSGLKDTHSDKLIKLYHAAESLPPGETFCPSVFPNREIAKPNPTDIRHAGFFCYDSGTPLNASTWTAAAWSAACASEGAVMVREGGAPAVYALCRPPGHHASKNLFGGYCYFNNAAIAAKQLKKNGSRVALVDIDFHHGNGTQALFYKDSDVLNISIHGDPREFYPFFSGYTEETGGGKGENLNINLPIPKGCDGQEYLKVMAKGVLPNIRKYDPDYLVISAGFDTYREDPIGEFTLDTPDFFSVGAELASLGLPTLIVQEGGYHSETLGLNVSSFLHGFRDGLLTQKAKKSQKL